MKMHLSLSLAAAAGTCLVQAHGYSHGSPVQHHHRRATTTATTATTATTTSSVPALTSPDKPTMTGTVSNCNKWYDVVEGDSCWSVEQAFGITQEQFLAWNPAVSSDCETNFQVGVSYCVGVGPAVSPSASSSSASVSTSTPSTTGTITSNSTATTPYSTLTYNTTTDPVTITDSTWPPTQTQSGQPSYCVSTILWMCRSGQN